MIETKKEEGKEKRERRLRDISEKKIRATTEKEMLCNPSSFRP